MKEAISVKGTLGNLCSDRGKTQCCQHCESVETVTPAIAI
nr:MAG TPA: hypothetical protein [Bacteriophage sp.]